MTKIFTLSAGWRCCAAQEFRAERQLCPTRKLKIFVLLPARRSLGPAAQHRGEAASSRDGGGMERLKLLYGNDT
jgi:hypothetical protein